MEANLQARVETITPDMAREYLKSNRMNRPLNDKTVNFYAQEMRAGNWKLNGEAICFAKNGALLNGQHRLSAIVKSGRDIQTMVIRGCDESAFVTYDSGRLRQCSDIFAIKGINNYSYVSCIATKVLALKQNATIISQNKDKGRSLPKKYSKTEILGEYYTSPGLYQEFYSFMRSLHNKFKIMRVIEAAAIGVFLIKCKGYTKKRVQRFFESLFLGENIGNETIITYREKIIRDRLSSSVMTSEMKQQLLIKAWNYYVTGKSRKYLTWDKEKEGKLTFM